jgi:hypothetical protein
VLRRSLHLDNTQQQARLSGTKLRQADQATDLIGGLLHFEPTSARTRDEVSSDICGACVDLHLAYVALHA